MLDSVFAEDVIDLTSLDREQLDQVSADITGSIKRRFYLSLTVMVIILSLLFGGMALLIYRQDKATNNIYISLQQRELGAKITALTQKLVSSNSPEQRRTYLLSIQAAADLMRENQAKLASQNGIIKMSPAVNAVYFQAPHKLDHRVKDFIAAVALLSANKPGDISDDLSQVEVIKTEGPGHLLNSFSAAVSAHVSSVEKSTRMLAWYGIATWAITIILLILQGVFIFKPTYLSVRRLMHTLLRDAQKINNDRRLEVEMRKHFKHEAQQQKAVLNSSNNIIFSTDMYGMIKTYNRQAERVLGYLEIEVVGKKTADFFHDVSDMQKRSEELSKELDTDVLVGIETIIAKAKQGKVDDYTWTLHAKTGGTIKQRLNYQALYNDQDEVTGFVASGMPS